MVSPEIPYPHKPDFRYVNVRQYTAEIAGKNIADSPFFLLADLGYKPENSLSGAVSL